MLVQIGYDMTFEASFPVPMVLKLDTHPSIDAQIKQSSGLILEPEIPFEEFTDLFGNRCKRISMPVGKLRMWSDAIVEVSDQPDLVNWDAQQHPVSELPPDTLKYLLGSRYCEIEPLSPIAWNLFGDVPEGWARVQAICDWVHEHIRYGYEFARPSKTAYEVYSERTGVCRDFAHLAIAFCRCLHIPARYATGYLGEIGVPPQHRPIDFHAWFEVYLDHQWYTFDARHNVPRIGRVLMARGCDATDVALTTSFGASNLVKFKVWAEEVASVYQQEAA